MDLLPALDQTFNHMHRVAGGVKAGDYGRATPCSEWDVAALMTHAFGVVAALGAVAGGGAPAAFELDRSAPAAQFKRIADSSLASWKKAGVLETVMDAGAGPMPGQAYACINLLDTLTHSWDLATATGQDASIDDTLATYTLGVCQQLISPEVRMGRFDPEVETGSKASATARLVGFLGRKA